MEAYTVRFHGSNFIIRWESTKWEQNPHERRHRNGHNKRGWQHINQQSNQIDRTYTFAYKQLGQPEDLVQQ